MASFGGEDAAWVGIRSRELETAVMLIEALREVRISDELAADDPAERRWMLIPLFLYIRAIKR